MVVMVSLENISLEKETAEWWYHFRRVAEVSVDYLISLVVKGCEGLPAEYLRAEAPLDRLHTLCYFTFMTGYNRLRNDKSTGRMMRDVPLMLLAYHAGKTDQYTERMRPPLKDTLLEVVGKLL